MPVNYLIRHLTRDTTRIGSSRDGATVVRVNDRAATREAIIHSLTLDGLKLVLSSEWHLKPPSKPLERDWDYTSLVFHHAGNSHWCDIDPNKQMVDIEKVHLNSGAATVGYHYAVACDGTIYEARDIRYKGEHVAKANTGKIGIVLLADLSPRGEAWTKGPSAWKKMRDQTVLDGLQEFVGQARDALDISVDTAPWQQMEALTSLCQTLKLFFPIVDLGGHRDYVISDDENRACPGERGLFIAAIVRSELMLLQPPKTR